MLADLFLSDLEAHKSEPSRVRSHSSVDTFQVAYNEGVPPSDWTVAIGAPLTSWERVIV